MECDSLLNHCKSLSHPLFDYALVIVNWNDSVDSVLAVPHNWLRENQFNIPKVSGVFQYLDWF